MSSLYFVAFGPDLETLGLGVLGRGWEVSLPARRAQGKPGKAFARSTQAWHPAGFMATSCN